MAKLTFADILEEGDEKLAKENAQFELLEEGDYNAEITKATASTNERTGFPEINLEFTLENKRKQWLTLRFNDNENSRKYAVRALAELGLDPQALRDGSVDPESVFVGKKIAIRVEQSTWEGKTRNQVRWLTRIPGVDYTTDLSAHQVSDTKESDVAF